MSANLANSAVATGLEKLVFIPIPKKGSAKECSNYWTIALICHASKVMLKILQSSLQLYLNWQLPDVQAGFRKGRRTRDQIAKICWIIEKGREFQKNIYFCFIDYAKAFDCVDHSKLWKILEEMGIQDHLSCLLRNLYAGQEAIVRTRHGTMNCPNLGKEYVKTVYCHLASLTSMQSTSCEMPGWMNPKLDRDCWEKYQQPQICRWYHSNSRKWRGNKELPDEGKKGEWKRWFETQYPKKIKKKKTMPTGPVTL